MELLKPKQNHKAIGERSEAIIKAKLLEVGYGILTPFGDNRRYDLVIEDAGGQFWRVQCKTAYVREGTGCIEFATASTYYHTRRGQQGGYGRRDYRGEVDYFAVYSPDTKQIYLVPSEGLPNTAAKLRLELSRNKQQKNVRWAEDYKL